MKQQHERLIKGIVRFKRSIKSYRKGMDGMVDHEFNQLNIQSPLSLYNKNLGGETRRKNKTMLLLLKYLSAKGNKNIKSFLTAHINHSKQFATNCMKYIGIDNKLKSGLIGCIRDEFPLKSICNGHEIMAIGPYILDDKIIKGLFGTNDYNKIKTDLTFFGGKLPFIGYQGHTKKEVVPIALIDIRENGTGYAGGFRLDMKLHQEFAKRLKIINKKIYGLE